MFCSCFFFFKQKTAYEMRISDWSSDVCSSDLMALLPADCSRHYVGKTSGYHSLPQPEINQLLADLALQNKRVVRLKGGDPFIFGRGAEELEFLLQRGIDCQVVPGITAAAGCSAYAGIPLTQERKSVVEGKSVAGRVDLGGRRSNK